MFDWDDLRHFLAVARAGSTLRAADHLSVSQPTVVRRIATFEKAIGTSLFERRRTGYALTGAGRAVLPLAERAEAEMLTLEKALASHRRRLAGTIRVTASESIGNMLVAPAVAAFRRNHPDVEVQLLIADRFLDILRDEADVALRVTVYGLADSELVGRKVGLSPWAIYCSRAYAAANGAPQGPDMLSGHAILGGEGVLDTFPAIRWLEALAADSPVAWRTDSLTNLHAAIRAGLGVSAIPCLLGGNDETLIKCFDTEDGRDPEVWLITRADLRRLPHIAAFIDVLADHVAANQALLLGRRAAEPAEQRHVPRP